MYSSIVAFIILVKLIRFMAEIIVKLSCFSFNV